MQAFLFSLQLGQLSYILCHVSEEAAVKRKSWGGCPHDYHTGATLTPKPSQCNTFWFSSCNKGGQIVESRTRENNFPQA